MDFLHAFSEAERDQIPGGALYYRDEASGQFVRLKVWEGGFLTVAWARPDYAHAQWEAFQISLSDWSLNPSSGLTAP